MTLRIAFQAAVRAASVDLLRDYAIAFGTGLQVYRARPAHIAPPCAFVDRMSEAYEYPGQTLRQRTPTCELVVLHGKFDDGASVDARDAFVDSFLDWVTDRYHAAGGNTLMEVRRLDDEPTFVPDWLPEAERRTYYGTRITLEGYAGG